MFSFQKILFPVDFSDHCQAIAPYIVDLANRFRAKLDLLHVVENGQNAKRLRWQREADLAAFAARIAGGRYLSQTVAYGQPAQTIVRHAQTHDSNIIAMPTRGNGSLRRWLLGSVTESVLRHAACAVWTESATGHPHTRWSPILCAVDLESGSDQVLSYASALAETFHANLIVVHAVPPIAEGSLWHPSHLPPALSHSEAQRKLEELLQRLNIVAETLTETGPAEDAIGLVANRTRTELLVIGRGARGRAEGSVGTHTYELVRTAPCPVVSCPRPRLSTGCFWTEWQQEESTQETDSSSHLIAGSAR
jgi:nucleotide-binding universal stress UspA family protein